MGLTDKYPSVNLSHTPTPLEKLPQLSSIAGDIDIWMKRDDLTGLAFGGNKVRKLEFYLGDALSKGCDMLLITGAVQSNYVRTVIAAARKLGMECDIQLEERVPGRGDEYYNSGNVLLDKIMGGDIHVYPDGEDEEGADKAMFERAEELKQQGKKPYVIQLSPGHTPYGALGYVKAAEELLVQAQDNDLEIDTVVVPTGGGQTHAGLLVGLRALGCKAKVIGFCVRRDKEAQHERVLDYAQRVADMIGKPGIVSAEDIHTDDCAMEDGYGQPGGKVIKTVQLVAQQEGVLLGPVYSGKAMAGLLDYVENKKFGKGKNVVFIHTGGLPEIFAYPELV